MDDHIFLSYSNNVQRTLPPKNRKHPEYESKYRELVPETIGSDNLREAVKLPPGVDINEWLAMNTVDFYKQISLLYATLEEFCTPTTCPVMNVGRYEYRWADGITVIEPKMVSAPEYVECLMNWIETQIDNEIIFPKNPGEPFPSNFEDFVKRILRKMFRVYAHIYYSHFIKIVTLNEHAHLNTCFKHFLLFVSEFQLVDKEEMAPIKDLVETVLKP
ncbi:putative MOB kinase activator-like 2B isoform X3 [Arabidopsis lyrata subsp. lyrata]|uniref:putative MOB kinase activator-like 2B isoform X3 n=1 Tax=Arabidopsis lyrata subsp. lyrata TaxID=81972 RepID=UPI000A29B30A|nr:putative MOB kinase activator-like 2B isoform X3 [Arabidopsis lyrata subsp. lyrata]|eukprot:XP_002871940.2 putative MOB kinase activator-like 2B isoform X3 [Arabidopsis lyrata subsp. lyrata]